MSFNLEVQGGKNYRLPVGGKYCPMDIDIAAIGKSDGLFCWMKKDPNTIVVSDIGYANAASSLKITPNNGVYSIATTSAGGWGYNYINTDIIDTTEKPLRVSYKAKLSAQNMFLGFSSVHATKYDAINEALYLTSGGAINHQRKGSQIAGYGSWTLNDEFVMEVYQGYFTVFKNGTQLFRVATTLTSACFAADLYAANATYGDFTFKTEAPKVIGYVVDDDINAYPQDGIAADGYYYVLTGAMKPVEAELKSASGTCSVSPYTTTVTGLDFKPYAVIVRHNHYLITAMNASDGTTMTVQGLNSSGSAVVSGTFVANDGGFTLTCNALLIGATFDFYAIGI